MNGKDYKLYIELVPSTSWYNNMRKVSDRKDWDAIRKRVYKESDYKCSICGAKGVLHCHEVWKYNDKTKTQTLIGFEGLCVDCHMIKHAGFSMHTEVGREKFSRKKLIKHFCKVNNCSEEDFYAHEEKAFKEWRERSKYSWKVDLGDYNKLVKERS